MMAKHGSVSSVVAAALCAALSAVVAEAVAASQANTQVQANESAPVRIVVRSVPSSDPGVNTELLDALDKYFEPSVLVIKESIALQALSESICGHNNRAWIAKVRARNTLASNEVKAGHELILPACPNYTLGGTITVPPNDTVSETALREIGQAGNDTLDRIARMNDTTAADLDNVKPGESLRVAYRTAPVSFALKREFIETPQMVVESLSALSTVIAAGTDLRLTLVGEGDARCEVSVPTSAYPLPAEQIADVLEFNAAIRPPNRRATIGVVDTGIDEGDARLFLGAGAVGANMDRRYPGFPTVAASYPYRAHGTHVAGLALGGLQSPRLNSLVRQRIQLRIINIVSRDVVASESGKPTEVFSIPTSNLMEAISYAKREMIPILSVSVETNTLLESFRDAFVSGDYLVVVAAGNTTHDIDIDQAYPASFRSDNPRRFITVAASTPAGSLATFSNFGNASVDIAAPGCDVPSLLPGGKFGMMTGTSQAAPLVAFASALLYAEGLNLQEVRNRIRTSARLMPEMGNSVGTGGVLDVPMALSIHEDVISLKGSAVPLRGTLNPAACLHIAGRCRPLARIARMTRRGDAGATDGWVWLKAVDGEAVLRATPMPTGQLKFTLRGASTTIDIPLVDVQDLVFALRSSP